MQAFARNCGNQCSDDKGEDAMGQAARQCSKIVASINAN